MIESRIIKPIREGINENKNAIKSEDEKKKISENVIKNNNNLDWGNSTLKSNRLNLLNDQQLFQRVNLRLNLISRRSLFITALHES